MAPFGNFERIGHRRGKQKKEKGSGWMDGGHAALPPESRPDGAGGGKLYLVARASSNSWCICGGNGQTTDEIPGAIQVYDSLRVGGGGVVLCLRLAGRLGDQARPAGSEPRELVCLAARGVPLCLVLGGDAAALGPAERARRAVVPRQRRGHHGLHHLELGITSDCKHQSA